MYVCLQYLSCVWSVIVYDTDPINKGISLFWLVFHTIPVYKSSQLMRKPLHRVKFRNMCNILFCTSAVTPVALI